MRTRTERVDSRTYLGQRLEPWFQAHFKTAWVRITAKLVAVVIVCGVAGAAYGLVTDKAIGVQPSKGDGTRPPAMRCILHGEEVACPAQYAVAKFKKGKMGRVHGVSPSRVWKQPAKARTVWIRKINRALAHHRAALPRTMRAMSAAQLYSRAMNTSTCAGHGSYSPYSFGFDVCTIQGPETRVSVEDIQKTGAVLFCGGGVVIGALTSEVGGWVIAFGASSCAWNAWMAMSD